MNVLVYQVLHIFGIVLAFASLGGLILQALAGDADARGRRLASISHGVALVVILVSGFGLLARLGLGFPSWAWLKIVIWVVVGALVVAIRRLPQFATVFWFTLPVLAGLAAYVALTKPA